jgi:CXCXC repeat
MDHQRFDEITKTLASGTSRRKMIKGLAIGALGTAFGLRRAATTGAAPSCRALGESCRDDSSCCPNQHLFCDIVGATGAHRCECTTGFVACGGVCVSISCPSGGQFDPATCGCVCPSGTELCGDACLGACPDGQVRNSTTCACECPSGQEFCGGSCLTLCTNGQVRNPTTCACECPSGTVQCDNGACVSGACPAGQTFNTTTCACECPTGQVFCNGCCHDPATACAGLHNKNFNAQCCSCENPGQPSGRCKNPPLTCSA